MKKAVWFLEYCLVVAVTFPFALMPRRMALRAGECLGAALFLLWGSRRRIAIDNLNGAIERGALKIDGDPGRIILEHFKGLGRSLVEVLKIAYGFGGGIIRDVVIEGVDNYRRACEKGLGVIIVTGHCGNWELAAIAFGSRIQTANIVARPLDNPFVNRFVERYREGRGNRLIYKKGAIRNILSALKRKESVAILIDQYVIDSEAVITEFLGKRCHSMKAPAVLALKTGAPVIPVFVRREGGVHHVEFGEEILLEKGEGEETIRLNTARILGYVEDYIRKYPSQWLWIHRRWKGVRGEPAGQ